MGIVAETMSWYLNVEQFWILKRKMQAFILEIQDSLQDMEGPFGPQPM